MLGELLQFYMFHCSHGNISFFYKMGKKQGKIKRELFTQKEFVSSTLAILLSFGNTLGAHAFGCPSLMRTTIIYEPPQQQKLQLSLVKRTLHFTYLKHDGYYAKRQATFKY
jgi:hypothetical protein